MRETGEQTRWGFLLRNILAGCVGFFLCCGLLFAGAMLLERGILPESAEPIFTYATVIIAVAFAGFFAAGRYDRRIVRSVSAAVVFLLLASMCGVFLGGAISIGRVLILCGVTLVGSVLGALLSGVVWR